MVKFCSNCGFELVDSVAPPRPKPSQCSGCHRPLNGAAFCGFCGTKSPQLSVPQTSPASHATEIVNPPSQHQPEPEPQPEPVAAPEPQEDLTPAPVPEPEPEPEPQPEPVAALPDSLINCTECGEPAKPDKFCGKCGHKNMAAAPAPEPQSRPEPQEDLTPAPVPTPDHDNQPIEVLETFMVDAPSNHEVETEQVTQVPEAPPAQNGKTTKAGSFCAKCGQPAKPGKFCSQCGYKNTEA